MKTAIMAVAAMMMASAGAQEMDHSGMDHSMHGMDHSQHAGPAATTTPVPALTDADRAAARPPAAAHAFHDNDLNSYLLLDRMEAWRDAGSTGATWEAKGWLGTDLSRVWLRSEGERFAGTTAHADVELLYGRSIGTWWDVVAGLRQDFAPGSGRTFAALGIQGLAPQRFEVSATAYFGDGSQGALRLQAEREVLFTNRLILQPLVELTLYSKEDAARGIGAGFSALEAGLRLRYEFTRRFAPYLGVAYTRSLGNTADLQRAAGETVRDTQLVAGLRTWF